VVRPGDNLWSIAESALAAAGPSPTPGEIVPYWRRLVDANRSRLARPDDPDLLFTGQVLVLPPHSPGPS
jgi:nucleoid-associated protein YgaU